MTYNTVYEHSL